MFLRALHLYVTSSFNLPQVVRSPNADSRQQEELSVYILPETVHCANAPAGSNRSEERV